MKEVHEVNLYCAGKFLVCFKQIFQLNRYQFKENHELTQGDLTGSGCNAQEPIGTVDKFNYLFIIYCIFFKESSE